MKNILATLALVILVIFTINSHASAGLGTSGKSNVLTSFFSGKNGTAKKIIKNAVVSDLENASNSTVSMDLDRITYTNVKSVTYGQYTSYYFTGTIHVTIRYFVGRKAGTAEKRTLAYKGSVVENGYGDMRLDSLKLD